MSKLTKADRAKLRSILSEAESAQRAALRVMNALAAEKHASEPHAIDAAGFLKVAIDDLAAYLVRH